MKTIVVLVVLSVIITAYIFEGIFIAVKIGDRYEKGRLTKSGK